MSSRRVAALLIALVLGACTGRSIHGPIEETPSPRVSLTEVPDEALVVCDAAGATAPTAVVRPQSDGIHVVFDNQARYREFFFPNTETWSDDIGHGGPLTPGPNPPVVTFNGPGEFLAGCFRNAQDEGAIGDPRYAVIRVVDPGGLYTPQELDCVPDERRVYHRAGSAADLDAIVRTIPGILPGDKILRPGYPDEGYMVEPRTVVRDGRVIARITLFGPAWPASPPPGSVEWKLWVDACPTSAIGGPPQT